MSDDDDDDHRPAITFAELAPILTAAVFAVGFFAALIWVLTTDDPWRDFIPKAKPAPSSEVTVTLPEKPKN